MVKKRAHKLRAVVGISDDYFDDDHNLIKGEEKVIEFDCRHLRNSKGYELRDEDGNMVNYSGVIFADKKADKIPYGTHIEVFDKSSNEVVASGKVLGVEKTQLYTQIWI
ncbi:Uncharacterised protein [Sphingobacterium multivorum]|uniref:hypothetical protein n=1 Tax=Sphingobacterium multivorum TaxID=28454 RepID=UPI000DFF85E5|nr:hypothetical protein [Sphingobacterium multivorum]QQT43355.1 hypothetical protein I6J00_16545 [Sphingobacterium multivorum]SUI98464.1 Uncharacterised protein [Sphingobacterium multivorum]